MVWFRSRLSSSIPTFQSTIVTSSPPSRQSQTGRYFPVTFVRGTTEAPRELFESQLFSHKDVRRETRTLVVRSGTGRCHPVGLYRTPTKSGGRE